MYGSTHLVSDDGDTEPKVTPPKLEHLGAVKLGQESMVGLGLWESKGKDCGVSEGACVDPTMCVTAEDTDEDEEGENVKPSSGTAGTLVRDESIGRSGVGLPVVG